MKKIRSGKYMYKGFILTRIGYHQPDKKVVWEAVDPKTGEAVAHGFSRKQVRYSIDNFLKYELKEVKP